jgi:DNA-binding transcriptional LysR family regulator
MIGASVDLQKLEIFSCIYEHGNLSKAAFALNTAPSVLSRQLAAFEKEVGGRLFYRTGRGMVLTELGCRIQQRVDLILDQHRQLLLEIQAQKGVISGNVRLGIVPSLARAIAAPLFRSIFEGFPLVSLQILEGATGQLDSWRSKDLVDITVLFRKGGDQLKSEDFLGEVDAYLVGPHGDTATNKSTVKFCELSSLPLVLAPLPNALRANIEEVANNLGLDLLIALETNSIGVQAELAANGGVHTIMAGNALISHNSLELQASRIVEPGITRAVALSISTDRPVSEATRLVARLIRQHIENSLKNLNNLKK